MMTQATTLRVLIVDDEYLARKRVRDMLRADREVEVIGECANGLAALDAIRHERPDLLFLDVQMPGMGGFDVLRVLEPELVPLVIFITAFDQYALRAFEASAVDYLLKPFDRARFEKALSQAKNRLRQERAPLLAEELLNLLQDLKKKSVYVERLAVKQHGRILYLKTAQIDWVEATGNYVCIHSGGQAYQMLGSISGLESQLDPRRFRRIHRGTIVNLDRIRELQPWFNGSYRVILHDGTELTLSRGYKCKQQELFEGPL